jgi:hypothetical protein
MTGLDAKDAKILWSAYAAGPDKDVLIGPNFHRLARQIDNPILESKIWSGDGSGYLPFLGGHPKPAIGGRFKTGQR